ncbi:Glycosyl transferase family 10 [Trinorchestia longiramus]|nr:Glycosyl transferase family 10 [Trinorchestia longiramus]
MLPSPLNRGSLATLLEGQAKYNMVPITYGLGHEFTGAPIDSYIDIFDFADAKALAEYILYLHSNITAYNGYFNVSQSGPCRPPGGVEEMQGGGRMVRLEGGAYITV